MFILFGDWFSDMLGWGCFIFLFMMWGIGHGISSAVSSIASNETANEVAQEISKELVSDGLEKVFRSIFGGK